MKSLFTILLSAAILCANAQTHLPVGPLGWGYGFGAWQPFVPVPSFDNSLTKNKWQLRPFASLSAGYVIYNGGGMSYLSAPVGLALFRPLNPNWTAFGAATVSTVFFNANRMSTTPINDPNYHGYPYSSGYGLGLATGVQGGLIYTNDAKTFSISGSVQIERSSYPVYPVHQAQPSKY